MKANTNLRKGSRQARSPYSLVVKSLIVSALILTGIQAPLKAQVEAQVQEDSITKPSWWFGVAAGANINFYQGTTQKLNEDLTVPAGFHHGNGIGLYIAPLMEFHRPDSRWGIMLQAGFDNRKGKFDKIVTPCNCPADLDAKVTYLTIEPSLRLAPFKSNFYLYAGPRFAFNLANSFTYKQGANPLYPDQAVNPDVRGDFSSTNKTIFSMQIGAGYDIPISSQKKQTQWVLSPFISFQPYFGQDPRSIETWTLTTLRVGATIKFGRGEKIAKPPKETILPLAAVVTAFVEPEVVFYINSPANVPAERRVRETFPIRNYVFFDLGSSEIPDRYVLLTKDQTKDFREDRLEVFTPKRLSGRSDREMVVYYNLLNILGDRMGRFPSTVIRLTGSSMEGVKEGVAMAESVKKYLVDVFLIDPKRINTEGRVKPRIPSEQVGGTLELKLLREGDHRVSIVSESPEILMEYQTGPNTPLKAIEFNAVQEAPIDSYVTFNVDGATEAFSSWSLEIKDSLGVVQKYGPYTQEKVHIPGKTILDIRTKGNFNVTMIGQTKNGKTVVREAPLHMVLWKQSEREMGLRYTIIYEFNSSDAIATYEKYLAEVVTPTIPKGGKVIISGYTDIIGDAGNNQRLSLARAYDVKVIIDKALTKAGRTDVKFEVYGFGENLDFSPFGNTYPEERFYNRSVMIDIIPKE
ncbi:MAG: flagellar motor protein MotB [Bacteroidales bacterium]|nr:MAG: flagellar motor protein MotB [Bacteroidales bacterium]